MSKQTKAIVKTNKNGNGNGKKPATNNNKKPDTAPASTDPNANLVFMFSKSQWLPMEQLTADQVGAEYKPQVMSRLKDGAPLPFMKATHEQIGEVVLSIPGNGNDVTVMRLEAIVNMPDPSDVSDEDKDVFDTPLASKFAHNPDAKDAFDTGKLLDAETIDHMMKIQDGRRVYEGGFAVLASDWTRQFAKFNEDGVVVDDPCWQWPRAGSGTKRNPAIGNEVPDYYKIELTDGGTIRGSVIDDMVMGSKLGEPFTMWKEIKKRASADSWLVSPADAARVRSIIVDPKLQTYVSAAINKDSCDQRAWETLDKFQNRDRNTLVSRWRQAIGFLQQRKAISDLPCVRVVMRGENDGAASVVTTPIQLLYRKPGEEIPSPSKALTIGQFLKINVPAAKLAAELESKTTNKKVPVSSGHLLATLRKEPKTPVPETPVKGVIRTFEELRDGVDSISLYLQTKGTFEQIQAVLNKNNEESKLLASSLCPMYDELTKIEPSARVLYTLYLAEQSTKNQKENIEKLNEIDPLIKTNKQKVKTA